MKIKDYKCKCGHDDFFFAGKGNQKGIYCLYCGKWLKWADKDERNLELKQDPILDKMRAKIKEQIDYHDEELRKYDSEKEFGISLGLELALVIVNNEAKLQESEDKE